MYTAYANELDEGNFVYEEVERTSDIQLAPMLNILLLAVWAVICLIGFAVMILGKNPVLGTIIIAVPTFIGMVIKPTFALCVMMLVLPTGAGIGYRQVFSLDRAVGIALAVSFALNLLMTRPRLRIANKALWVVVVFTIWVFLASLAAPHLSLELQRAFTQVQLLALILIVCWIIEANGERAFRWALRAYVIGVLGTTMLAFLTGAAVRTLETPEGRYAATLGKAIDANMLAALTSIAFLAAIYLLARDKNIFWRVVHFIAILFLPTMLLRIGSRGALTALIFTMLSPLLFVRQVLHRPALAVLLVAIILLASISAGLLVRSGGLEAPVVERLTDVGSAKEAISYRMEPTKAAVRAVIRRPAGTSFYAWFERAGARHWPHSDFFFALGIYGIPGAILFLVFVIMMVLTVKRIPLGLEKLYARAVLTFLLVMGLNIKQIGTKYFWVFLAFVLAAERIGWLNAGETGNMLGQTDEETADIDYQPHVSQ
jgi:hypothetical protein